MKKDMVKMIVGGFIASMAMGTSALADCVVTRSNGQSVLISGTCSQNFVKAAQPTTYEPLSSNYAVRQSPEYQGHYGYRSEPYYSRYHVTPDYNQRISDNNTVAVQTKLTRLGYWVGPAGVNGVRGHETIQAIKQFQKTHGLKVDGVVGPETAYKLNELAANFDYSHRWVRYPDYAYGYYR
jgi:hypothetical protein